MNGSQLFDCGAVRFSAVTGTASGGSGRSVSRFSIRSTGHSGRARRVGGRCDPVDAEPTHRLEPLRAPEHAAILTPTSKKYLDIYMYLTYVVAHASETSRTRFTAAGAGRPGEWAVRARVERFHEPALLLLLRERPRHGYELIELLPGLAGGDRIDVGNLYRFLRGLEMEGLVESEWHGDLPGPAKRTYRLTEAGERAARPVGRRAPALARGDLRVPRPLRAKGGE